MASYIFSFAPFNPWDDNNPQQTYFSGINDLGQIVGSYTYTYPSGSPSSPSTDGFVYNPGAGGYGDGYVPLNSLYTYASATGINQQGQIVGYFENSLVGPSNWQGFLDNNGTFTPLDFPGAATTQLWGINDSDQIVGDYTDQSGNSHGFVYSSGSWNVISGPTGYNISYLKVTGVNDSGQIVGYFWDASALTDRGFIDNDGTYIVLNGPPGGGNVVANAINTNGTVAGWYTDGARNQEGFLYQNGQYTTIDQPGATDTYINGVNDSGEIIGFAYFSSALSNNSFPYFIAKALPTPPNVFNADDKADILWQNTNDDVYLWNSSYGSESFTGEDLGIVAGGWQIAGTGSFNGASEASILWRNANGDTALWNPNGSGGYSYDDLGVVLTSWQVAGTGDFNASGEGILWRNANGDTALWNPNGSGGFTFQDLGVVPSSWQIAGTGDFTGTGETSILWQNSNGDAALWNSNGSGGFTYDDLGVIGGGWQVAGTGDFSGNGEDSILWRNSNGDTALWNPNGSGGFTYEDLGVVPTSWQIAGTGDFTGGGKSGILWRNASGDTALWNPNGSGDFTFQDLGVVSGGWSVQKIFA